MKSRPSSPLELLSELKTIFPSFGREVELEEDEEAELTYHAVFLFHFNSFFSKHISEFSSTQLKDFAQLLARSLAAFGSLANAVDTCFLEHVRQLGVERALRAHMKKAQEELRP